VALASRELMIIMRARNYASQTFSAVGKSIGEVGNEGVKTADKLKGLGQGLISMAVGLSAIGGAGLYFIYSSAKAFAQYQQQAALSQTQTESLGLSLQQIENLGLDIGSKYGVPLADVQKAIYNIFSATNATLPQAKVLLGDFAKAAIAAGNSAGTLGLVSKSTAQLMNAFHIPIADVNKVLDVQFQLVSKGAGTYQEFMAEVGQVAPAMTASNQSLQTMAGLWALMTRNGLTAPSAAAALARASEFMLKPTFEKGMKSFGLSIYDASGHIKQMNTVVTELANSPAWQAAVKKYGGIASAFTATFGAGTIQARRFFDVALNDSGQMNSLVNDMVNSQGSMQKAFDMSNSDQANRVQQLSNLFTTLKIVVGQQLAPIIGDLIGAISHLIQWFLKLSPHTRALIIDVMAGAAVLTTLTAILLGVAGALLIVAGSYLSVAEASGVAEAGGMLKYFTGMLDSALPVVAIVLAVAAAVYLVIKYHKDLIQWATTAWNYIVVEAQKVWAYIYYTLAPIIQYVKIWWQRNFNDIVAIINGFISIVTGIFAVLFAGWKDALQTFVKVWIDIFTSMWPTIESIFSGAFAVIAQIIKTAVQIFLGIIQTFIDALTGNWSGAWDSLKSTVTDFWNNLGSIITTGIQSLIIVIKNGVSGFGTLLKSAGKDLIHGLIKGVTDTAGAAKTAVHNVLHPVTKNFDNVKNSANNAKDAINHLKNTLQNMNQYGGIGNNPYGPGLPVTPMGPPVPSSGGTDVYKPSTTGSLTIWSQQQVAAFKAVGNAAKAVGNYLTKELAPDISYVQSWWKSHSPELVQVWSAITQGATQDWNIFVGNIKLNYKDLKQLNKDAGNWESAGWKAITKGASEDWKAFKDTLSQDYKDIGQFDNTLWGILKGAWHIGVQSLEAGWNAMWPHLKQVGSDGMRIVRGAISLGLHFILGDFGIILDLLTGHWGKAWHDLSTTVTNVFHDIWTIIKGAFGTIYQTITGAVSGYGTMLAQAGKDLISGLINGITSKASDLWHTITNVGTTLLNDFKKSIGSHSPSVLFAKEGVNIYLGIIQGLLQGRIPVAQALQDLIDVKKLNGAINLNSIIGTNGINSNAAVQSSSSVINIHPGAITIPITATGQNPQQVQQDVTQAIEKALVKLLASVDNKIR